MKPKTQLELRISKMIENEGFRNFMISTLTAFKFNDLSDEFLVDVIMMNPNIYLKPPQMLVKMNIQEHDIDFTDCIKKYGLEDNKKVIINSINKSGSNLKLASKALRNNKDVVKRAIKNNGEAIEFASNKLKNDTELATIAINNNPDSYFKISEELKNNIEIIKTLLIKDPSLLKNFDYVNKYNSLVKEVIRHNGLALKYAPDKMKDTKTIVLSAARNNLKSLIYASNNILNDQEFLIEIAKKLKSDQILYYASTKLQTNKMFIMRLIKETNLNLYLINDSLKDDLEIVTTSLDSDVRNLTHASSRIRKDKIIILDLIRKHGNILNYVDKSLLSDELFMYDAIMEYNGCIKNNVIKSEEFIGKLSLISDWCNNYIKNNIK